MSSLSNYQSPMSRYQRIYDALSLKLKPEVLVIDNESNRHQVPEGSETHFKVVVVSLSFENSSRVARHRLINTLLKTEFTTGLHALSLHLYTPEEWIQHNMRVSPSPACRNKKRHE